MNEPTIIFQDDAVAVLDKPSGLLVHAVAQDFGEKTLADWLLENFPQVAGVGEEGRWGIVHRLDRETGGIMVAAKTREAYARLKKQFARREIHKTYRSFVYGNIKEARGVIDKAIGRSATGNRTALLRQGYGGQAREANPLGRQAQTTFKTLLRSPEASYLELYPKTGRTHQIRVHLSALQHPVVCDSRYAPHRPAILGFARLALHAYKLSFIHPTTGRDVSFEAPLPPDFVEAERLLKSLDIHI